MPRADATPKHSSLPIPLSSFIGRTHELAEVRQLLRTERLVTLTGAGGSGKTRLALQAAQIARDAFEDGVTLVELAPLADGSLVPQAVATALEIGEQPGQPLATTVAEYLESRQLLLVIDNCEHVVRHCAEFAEMLLQRCPALTILATSREPLGIAGEVIRIIPPLSLPSSPTASTESEAVQLFVARAQSAAPGFELTAENRAAVAEICQRLDGMPLAIELAAARLRSLSAQQIAALLVDRFGLLTGGSRTAPARQQTLEATLDWSYALLPEVERQVYQRLSVFAGGCTLEAAEAVCGDDQLDAAQVRDALGHLVDKSLVIAESVGSEARYHMLETVREYGRKKLPGPEAAACRDRHLTYFVEWSENMERLLLGPELARGVQLYGADHDNVRAALDWSQQSPRGAEAGLRLAAGAWNFWRVIGYHSEGRARLSAALAHPGAQASTIARANALHCAALHAFYQSDYPACKSLLEQSRTAYAQLGTAGRNGVADSLELLAEVASETGEYDKAFQLFQEALPVYEEVGDMMGQGDTLKMLGFQSMRSGKLAQAKEWLDRGLEVCLKVGEQRHICSALAGLGEWHIRSGEYPQAKLTLNRALSISRATGEKWNIAINLGSLAWVALLEGDLPRMAELLRESLAIRQVTGDRSGTAWCLEKMGRAAALGSKFEAAAMMFGAAAALRRPMRSQMDGSDRPDYEEALRRIQQALGEPAFSERWDAGEKMPAEEVIQLGLSLLEGEAAGRTSAVGERPGGLTTRELEVATLIAEGRSNREIADAMSVGVKTVETYVTRILGKLGLHSRVQVATWAVGNGMASRGKDT